MGQGPEIKDPTQTTLTFTLTFYFPPMSFRNLTIGKKITLGFALLFALLMLVAAIAYLALGSAGRRLAAYADSAQDSYAAATLESSMQALKL